MMRFFLLFIISIATVYHHNNLIGQTVSDTERNVPNKNAIYDQIPQIIKQIDDQSIPFEKILPKIKQLENLSNENLYWYLETMRRVIVSLQKRDKDEKASVTRKEIIAKAAFLALDESTESNTARQCEVLYCQLSMLLYRYRFCRTELFIDCDPGLRYQYVSRLIDLFQLILSQIDETYDPHSREHIFISGQNFVPPPSYQGRIIPGKDYSKAEDEATREAYKKYMKEEHARMDKRTAQMKAREVRNHDKKPVQKYLIDAYSLFPYRTAELEQILTEKKVDPEMSQTILDAVRKVEKENPDKGFRIWLSNDKLLKVTAKFISFNNDEVTLEKQDGTRMTIELSAFRKEDQDFVKQQLDQEKESVKDFKTKN
jgi:hypothetical protein